MLTFAFAFISFGVVDAIATAAIPTRLAQAPTFTSTLTRTCTHRSGGTFFKSIQIKQLRLRFDRLKVNSKPTSTVTPAKASLSSIAFRV